MARFDTAEKVEAELAKLKDYWSNLLSTYTLDSGDEKLDRMVNIWNQYQCMVTFNMSRSASFFESGIGRGMGFRDSNQDLIGFVHQVPDRAKQRILDIGPLSLKMVLLTTSTSLLPSAVTTLLAVTLMTTRCG